MLNTELQRAIRRAQLCPHTIAVASSLQSPVPPHEPINLELHRLVRDAERIEEMFARNESAQRILSRDIFRPSCAEVIAVVAEYYGRTMDEMRGARRGGGLALHRQVAAYLCIRFTLRSLPEIGRQFGRDHSTIHHANARIKMLRETDARLRDDLQILIMRIIDRTGFQPER
jgi:chromosomal replication initiation ATPase DnaA